MHSDFEVRVYFSIKIQEGGTAPEPTGKAKNTKIFESL